MPWRGGGHVGHELAEYYEHRASEYDSIYQKPERQADLTALKTQLRELFSGRKVLEVAAGTGYWTQVIAPMAASVLATDLNSGPLNTAKIRDYGGAAVDFQVADAFELGKIQGEFNAAFAGFWWSHLSLDQVPRFVDGLAQRLPSGSLVVAIDNRYVPENSTPIARRDAAGNTYQQRVLSDGGTWEILKNFPEPDALRRSVLAYSEDVSVHLLTYYWVLRFTLR